jgi:hypothetical protein
LSGKK